MSGGLYWAWIAAIVLGVLLGPRIAGWRRARNADPVDKPTLAQRTDWAWRGKDLKSQWGTVVLFGFFGVLCLLVGVSQVFADDGRVSGLALLAFGLALLTGIPLFMHRATGEPRVQPVLSGRPGLVFPYSKKALGIAVTLMLLMGAAAITIGFDPETFGDPIGTGAGAIRILAFGSGAVFLSFAAVFGIRGVRGERYAALTEDGILLYFGWSFTIPWTEVTAVKPVAFGREVGVGIMVRDKKKIQLPTFIRLSSAGSRSMVGADFMLPARGLEVAPRKLLSATAFYFENPGERTELTSDRSVERVQALTSSASPPVPT
jgi:hypothetical protein